MKIKSVIKTILSMDLFKAVFLLVSILGVCPISAVVVTPLLKVFHLYGFPIHLILTIHLINKKKTLENWNDLLRSRTSKPIEHV